MDRELHSYTGVLYFSMMSYNGININLVLPEFVSCSSFKVGSLGFEKCTQVLHTICSK